MRIVVTGGRDYTRARTVWAVLASVNPDRVYVGDAPGADTLAAEWCRTAGVGVSIFEADWDRYQKAAGPIRNERMLRQAMHDGARLVIAFPGGAGTNNCVGKAKELGMIVLRVEEK